MVFVACSGDDDGAPSNSGGDDSGTSSESETATGESSDDSNSGDANSDDNGEQEEVAVRAPLEAGSTAEVAADDIGKVRYTIVSILDPADELLGLGLETDPGFRLYAVEVLVEALEAGDPQYAANSGWWTLTTKDGEPYEWIGTGGGKDLGYGEMEVGQQRTGFMAFQIPDDADVGFITVEPSIYVGYDIVFETN